MSGLREGQYLSLATYAAQARNIERVLLGIENQVRWFGEDGLPPEALLWSSEHIPHLRKIRDRLMRECAKVVKGSDLHAWATDTYGLGPAIFFVAGFLPPIENFKTVSGLWKYLGLHVIDGSAVKRTAGKDTGFNVELRACALMRVAEPMIKARGMYRPVYDARKEHTLETHPPMLTDTKKTLANPDCEFCLEAVHKSNKKRKDSGQTRARLTVGYDCSNVGGVHWTAGHRHADALRVTAKAIFRDAWRVTRDLAPKYAVSLSDQAMIGDQSTFDRVDEAA